MDAGFQVADQQAGDAGVIRWLAIERAVVFGERGERGLGLPRHLGVALTTPPLVEHFNQAGAFAMSKSSCDALRFARS